MINSSDYWWESTCPAKRATVVVFTLFVVLLPRVSLATPRHLRLSFIGDPASQLGIAWNTYHGPAEALVEYGLYAKRYTWRVWGKSTRISPRLGTISEVVLSQLEPNTRYYYRAGGPRGGFSAEHTFLTGPRQSTSCATIRWAYIGDSRANTWEGDKGSSDLWPQLLEKARARGARFVLHGGDIVLRGTKEAHWYNFLTATEPFSAKLPIMYSLGNHDRGPGFGELANYNRLFLLPRADRLLGGSGTEDYYFFPYGPAIFVALSSESYRSGTPPFVEQAQWLDRVLTRHPARWKFVFIHRPIYTQYLLYSHRPNEVGQNEALVPIITKHDVDVVIGSHNHFYERWAPSACADGASPEPCPVDPPIPGTTYLTSGGGGAFPIFFAGWTNATRLVASGKHHLLLFQLRGDVLRGQALASDSSVIDRFSIRKGASNDSACPAPAAPPAETDQHHTAASIPASSDAVCSSGMCRYYLVAIAAVLLCLTLLIIWRHTQRRKSP